MYGAKSQRPTYQIEISKISGIDIKKRCKDKNDQMLSKEKKPNEKLLTQCNQVFVGSHICSFLQLRQVTLLSASCV